LDEVRELEGEPKLSNTAVVAAAAVDAGSSEHKNKGVSVGGDDGDDEFSEHLR
jgi:hypothetical protein